MGPLIRLIALAAAGAPGVAAAQGTAAWQPYIAEASARCGVPADWIARVMRTESDGNTTMRGRPIVSRAGAMGLMQLMPPTWVTMRDALALGPDPFDPHDNIIAGTCYLRMMYDRFGYPGLFTAYNAGPARYQAWLAGRWPLPAETIAYQAKIASSPPRTPAVRTPFVSARDALAPFSAAPLTSSLFAVPPRF